MLALCVHRWGPLGDWGIWAGRRPLLAPLVSYGSLLLAGSFGYAWLLRRRVLLHHGLGWSRPGLAQVSLGLVLTAAGLCLVGVGPFSFLPAALAAGLFVVGGGVAWRAGVLGRPCTDRAQAAVLRGFEGRVGLACLGVALCLIGAVELVAVAPRRHRLATQVDRQVLSSWTQSATNWGDLRNELQSLLHEAGDEPIKAHLDY